MTHRLARIEFLIVSLTTLAVVGAHATGALLPGGIALGGLAALAEFVLIRWLAAAALRRKVSVARIVPLALTKSLVLVAIAALALMLPHGVIDGISFATGVSALPAAVVVDALWPVGSAQGEG